MENKIIDFNNKKAIEILQKYKINEDSVTLKECIDISTKFLNKEIDEDEFNKFGTRINIRAYIPIIEKMKLIIELIGNAMLSTGTTSSEIIMTEMYKDIFYKVLLKTYAQIDLGEEDYQTYNNYDLLFPFFYSYIMQFCKQDYDIFMDMLKNSLTLNNILKIMETMDGIDSEKIKKYSEHTEKLIKELNDKKELIESLRDIALFNDPNLKYVLKEVRKMSKENIKENKQKGQNKNNESNNEIQ